MENNEASKSPALLELPNDYSLVDEITCVRAGSLSAHGLSDLNIADVLLLSPEQFIAAKQTAAFKKKYAEEAEKAIQAQIDRDEGWDAVEEAAIAHVLQTLEYNRDPKFALAAAAVANKAVRRKQANSPHVVDAENKNGNTNIIVLNLNRNFATRSEDKTIDVTPRTLIEDQPQRRSDVPSPKLVNEMLAPVLEKPVKVLDELEQAFKDAGVFNDE